MDVFIGLSQMLLPFLKALVATLFISAVAGTFFSALVAVIAIQNHLGTPFFMGAEAIAGLVTLALSVLFFQRAFAFERYGDARAPAAI